MSLRGGLTAYHPGSPKEILPHFDRDFNRIHFGVGKVAGSIFNIILTSQRYKKDQKILILSGFQSKCPLFELAPVRCFLNRFAYRISLRVLTFFSLFRLQGLSDFLLPWCCHIIGVNLLSLILVGRSECHSYTRLISYFLFNDIYYNPWTIS